MFNFHRNSFDAAGFIFCAFFTFAAIACAGTYSGGSGSPIIPYRISSVADWQELIATEADWGKSFALVNDIDFAGTMLTPVAPDTVVDDSATFDGVPFTGVLNGKGFALRNITLSMTGDFVALFGCIGGNSRVYNLNVTNLQVEGNNEVGGLVGRNDGTISGCTISGKLLGKSSLVGGLCGKNRGTIKDCQVTVEVSGEYSIGGVCGLNDIAVISKCTIGGTVTGTASALSIGGVCGENFGTIDNNSSSCQVNGIQNVGGLCGNNIGTISTSSSSSPVSGVQNVGGLCGKNRGTISGCSVAGDVGGENAIGGLCGFNEIGDIQNCSATGTVIGSSSALSVGGLCGENWGTIRDNYSTGNTSGRQSVGGLCGDNRGTISDCYSSGSVNGQSFVGGLLGLTNGASVSFCYSIGPVSGDSDVGGFVGNSESSTFTGCFWGIETTGQTTSAGGEGKTTTELKMQTTFASVGWDLEYAWIICDGIDYPHLLWEGFVCPETGYSGGYGTAENPFQISTVADWQEFIATEDHWDSHFVLLNDIDFLGVILTPVAPDTNTTGSFQGTPFTGVFDGQGHILRNVTIELPVRDYIGLFGFVGIGAQIRSLQMEDVAITGRKYVGALCGWNDNASIGNCSVSGIVIGPGDFSEAVGGLCGENNGGEIAGCSAMTDLEGGQYADHFGGLCGVNTGTIRDCSTGSGMLTGGGGLCGLNDHGTILRCQSFGSIFGGGGGLCGKNVYGTIDDCYATVDITGGSGGGLCWHNENGAIRNSHATGSVSGTNNLGGLIGETFEGQIENCTAHGAVTGETDSSNVGGLCGYISGGTIRRCSATGAVAAGVSSMYIGGLCGTNGFFWSVGASIRDSYATGTVHGGSQVGGLCGYTMSGVFAACYASGSVSGTSYIGGMCGTNESGTLSDCYATGAATGTQYVGGFAGYNYRGKIYRCYSSGGTTGTTSVGGFCGQKDTGAGYDESGNFWDMQSTQMNTSAMGTGKMTSQMRMKPTFTAAGWDFTSAWTICEATNYPRLQWQIPVTDWVCPDGVAIEDLMYLAGRWMAGTPETAGAADANDDGKVNLVDLAMVSENWMR